ncbi:GGDEF domain-containing response regulator [Poseidonibacter lekithochrous]|uniref:GGDEF domain-containing response regulator n=1 Tax=Poseidonibacter lekithochrous TaxID=1904463 RepID=UPI000D3AF265|nr:diguanylate cyclase [Poseidonibacter lekithochrous]
MNNKILVVDDSESSIEILVELLGSDYDVLVALDGETAIEIANEDKPKIILLDIVMPEINGFEVCQRLKNSTCTKDIPIIFITAKSDEESIEMAYDLGGIDYVTKPFKSKELLARVKTQIELKNLITSLEYLSSHDTMTGILNRRKFFELAALNFNKKIEKQYSVMIDIDRFKNINDLFGHHMGDTVIKKIVNAIDSHVKEDTLFARLGGEEFVLFGQYDSKDSIYDEIEFIRKKIEDLEIYEDKGAKISVTISCGISFYNDKFTSIDELLKDADEALYEAKGQGRNKSIIRNS